MDFKVQITQAALNDLEEIVEYISRDSVRAAQRMASGLLHRAESLAKMPWRGRVLSARPGVRRLVRTPYLIIYRVEESARIVKVLRFWHEARNPDSLTVD